MIYKGDLSKVSQDLKDGLIESANPRTEKLYIDYIKSLYGGDIIALDSPRKMIDAYIKLETMGFITHPVQALDILALRKEILNKISISLKIGQPWDTFLKYHLESLDKKIRNLELELNMFLFQRSILEEYNEKEERKVS